MRGEYLAVTLMMGGKKKKGFVHIWVLSAFRGKKPMGMDSCHNDGSRTNNQIDNLRYDTREGNFADKNIHGTHLKGERHPKARLTESDVLAIRSAVGTQEDIGQRFGVHQTNVSDIKLRKIWTHI